MRGDKGLILLSMSIVDKEGLLLSEHASHRRVCPLLHNPNRLLAICVLMCHGECVYLSVPWRERVCVLTSYQQQLEYNGGN